MGVVSWKWLRQVLPFLLRSAPGSPDRPTSDLLLPILDLTGDLIGRRRAIADKRRDGSFHAEHVVERLVQVRMYVLKILWRKVYKCVFSLEKLTGMPGIFYFKFKT